MFDLLLDAPTIDPDPESKLGSPLPLWYSLLKSKFENHLLTHKLAEHFKFTLGKFAVFLANCLDATIPTTEEENDALAEVTKFNSVTIPLTFSFPLSLLKIMEASKDNLSLFHHDNAVFTSNKDQKKRYIAHRFFNFMKSVPELRYEFKDEDSVKKMKFHD